MVWSDSASLTDWTTEDNMAHVYEQVTRWLPVIEEVRQELDVTSAKYGDCTILSLIHVESRGDECAHRENSQFWGLLQMGTMAGLDVGCEPLGGYTTRHLHGDGRNAIRQFIRYQERYSARHSFQPTRIAALWKGGPGTLRAINEKLAKEAISWQDALKYAEEKHNIYNLVEYLRRFTEAFQAYAFYLDDVTAPYPRYCAEPTTKPGREPDGED
jgi:hypothetical protein